MYHIPEALLRERRIEFVYTPIFERTRKGVLTDDEMRAVEDELLADPCRGALMRATSGVRKIRAAQEDRGKSGSARVVYLHVPEREAIYFLIAFAKNVKGNLTAAECRLMRQVVAMIREEPWPGRKRAWT